MPKLKKLFGYVVYGFIGLFILGSIVITVSEWVDPPEPASYPYIPELQIEVVDVDTVVKEDIEMDEVHLNISEQDSSNQTRILRPPVRYYDDSSDQQFMDEDSEAQSYSLRTNGCAENGSCYGDISEDTGRPKTINVNGYYRDDGNYVQGHYRSHPSKNSLGLLND